MEEKLFTELKGALTEIKTGITDHGKRIDEIAKSQKDDASNIVQMRSDLDSFRKAQLSAKQSGPRRKGHVSEACARHIFASVMLGLEREGLLEKAGYDSRKRDTIVGHAREILGVEAKAALTTSDIPLPVNYGQEVVELVGEFGAARQYGTVYPLGAATTNLPRLKTSPAFGLIAMSATVTEKSPQTEWVQFDAKKWGGLVRLPSEIDADSSFAIGQFLARYAAREFAKIEDTVFFTADGTGTYGNLAGLTSSTITNSKVFQQASTKTKYSDITLAYCRSLRAVPDASALRNGAYYFHPSFEQAFAAMNTSGDKPYQPNGNGLGGATLDGFPIRWVDTLPVYSTSANVSKVFGLFGDMSFQYLGERLAPQFEVSREVFFATDEMAVRALERFTIGLMAVGAIAGIQTAAS
jgi:HK97 family phage major capsid protein